MSRLEQPNLIVNIIYLIGRTAKSFPWDSSVQRCRNKAWALRKAVICGYKSITSRALPRLRQAGTKLQFGSHFPEYVSLKHYTCTLPRYPFIICLLFILTATSLTRILA
jgi:hypothetical protein